MSQGPAIFVIYYDTDEYPGEVVARLFWGDEPKDILRLKTSLEGDPSVITSEMVKKFEVERLREIIQGVLPGATKMSPLPEDHPAILEAWL